MPVSLQFSPSAPQFSLRLPKGSGSYFWLLTTFFLDFNGFSGLYVWGI